MAYRSLPALFALSLLLSACGTQPQTPPPQSSGQLELKLASGLYSCEQGIRLQIEREYQGKINHRILVRWNGGSYHLDRDPSHSGLPRFADNASGLVWIDLPWNGLLLDSKTNRPLANECRSA